MSFLKLLIKSILHRKQSLLISISTIVLSLLLILFIESLKDAAKSSFTNTISKTDLIVGEKTGKLQLILYSLFHLGSPINNIDYESYLHIKNDSRVKWTIPLSFGDGHRGYRVIGTTNELFSNYRYRVDKKIHFSQGHEFKSNLDVVIGSKVADELKYQLNRKIVVSHGISVGSPEHDHLNFKITGILSPTQTPLDKAIFVKLEAIELLHDPDLSANGSIEVHQISSFLLGLKSRIHTLHLQRYIDEYEEEPLMAAIPALELNNLWKILEQVENVLIIISIFILLVAFLNMLIAILSSLNERKKEMAILRSLGLSPFHICTLLISEAFIITLSALVISLILFITFIYLTESYMNYHYGLSLTLNTKVIKWLILFMITGPVLSLYPAIKAFKQTLKNGLNTSG